MSLEGLASSLFEEHVGLFIFKALLAPDLGGIMETFYSLKLSEDYFFKPLVFGVFLPL